MRIGIDGSCLANRRGFGRFARELLKALARKSSAHEVCVFVDQPSLDSVIVPALFRVVGVPVRVAPARAASATGRRRVGDMLSMGRAVARERLDLVYFPASYSFFPVWNARRVVVTMHDTLALAHPELVFPHWSGRLAWKAKEHAALAWADRIVTVSQTSRRDLIDWFGLTEDRVVAITEGPDQVFSPRDPVESAEILRKYGIDPARRFFLYVGGLSPHKNLSRLIEAYAALPEGIPLVIVGDFGDVFHTHVPELRAVVDRSGQGGRILFTGFVPDGELAHLYSRAYALVQPSLMEGFGLPAVEAMACGTPVVSSTAGSLPEVIGDAGLFFDPLDVPGMAARLNELLDDPGERDRLARQALERSGLFTWDLAADQLIDAFEAIAIGKASARRSA